MSTYAVITPTRDEAANLRRLGAALAAQTVAAQEWIIVDAGSTDQTVAAARELAADNPWIRLHEIGSVERVARGDDARAFQAGIDALTGDPDVIVKLDADVSMAPDYFERLLAAFDAEPLLGMASGVCYERTGEDWVSRNVTGSSVWGAARAYRRECLNAVLPLEVRFGWDGVDEIRANARGWRTETLVDLPFKHHRREGERDTRLNANLARGRAARYMGYSPVYLALRALHHARAETAALAMLAGYAAAALRREPRCPDDYARAYLRRQQRLRNLGARRREASRPRTTLPADDD